MPSSDHDNGIAGHACLMMRGVVGSNALAPPGGRWSRVSPSGLAATVGGLWSVGCLAFAGWLFQQYFASRDTFCPPAADLAAFCRANLADGLGANLKSVSLAFLVGLILTGAIVGLTSLLTANRCSSCGGRRRLEPTACDRCGFNPFA